jgi:hypothetical protein
MNTNKLKKESEQIKENGGLLSLEIENTLTEIYFGWQEDMETGSIDHDEWIVNIGDTDDPDTFKTIDELINFIRDFESIRVAD